MKLKKYLAADDIDVLQDQMREVNDVVLGENTFLFFENPLLEGEYYPINAALNEDELSHFALLNEITREEKARRKEAAAEYKAARDINPEDNQSEVDKEVMKAVADLNKKSKGLKMLTGVE